MGVNRRGVVLTETHLRPQVQTLPQLSQQHLCQQSHLQSEWMVTAACQPPLMDSRRQKHYTPMVFTHIRVNHHQKHWKKIQKCKRGDNHETTSYVSSLLQLRVQQPSILYSRRTQECSTTRVGATLLAHLCQIYLGQSVFFLFFRYFWMKHSPKSSQVKMNFPRLT